jgi:hypothetical protein
MITKYKPLATQLPFATVGRIDRLPVTGKQLVVLHQIAETPYAQSLPLGLTNELYLWQTSVSGSGA